MLEKNVLMFFYSLHIQWLLKQFSLRCICNFLIIGTRQQLEKTSIESIIIGDTVIKPLESVRNLGSWFDAHMRMNVHIGKICSKASRGLYNITQIRKFLTVQSSKTMPLYLRTMIT